MKFSIRNKLIIYISLIVIIIGGVSIYFSYSYINKLVFDYEKKNVKNLSQQISREIVQIMKPGNFASEALATDNYIIDYLEGRSDIYEIDTHLNLFNRDNIFSAIYIMDHNGLTLASTDKSFIGKNYSFRNYFKQAVSGRQGVDVAAKVKEKIG